MLDQRPLADSPAAVRWQLGRDALARGDAAAVAHLQAALEFHPASPAVLLDLAVACTEPGERARWTERLVRALGDARGRAEFGKEVFGDDRDSKKRAATLSLDGARSLAQLRAQAAAELARAVGRAKPSGRAGLGSGAVARHLTELFVLLCGDAPQLLRAHGDAFDKALGQQRIDAEAVCAALSAVAQGRFGAAAAESAAGAADEAKSRRERAALALAAARILRGLCQQASYRDDVRGDDVPDLERYVDAADSAIAAANAQLGEPRVWTIAELQALDAAGRDEFTAQHAHWDNPGVCYSTTGKYRIETVCGHETLLGAATTIEFHHDRLAQHMGGDPFGDRPGLVRIAPDVSDLEIGGSPYWWAGGFQSGDLTMVRFAFGRIAGLGRGLTHELTHRFDGAMRAFGAPWYGEGHATWTAEHYVAMVDRDFVDDHLELGRCIETYVQGYADQENFEKLLRGEVEDYRHNYFAGYTLYAYLRGWPPQEPPRFRAQLERYEKNARSGQRDPVGYFTRAFCDGRDGRPSDLPGFVAGWREFLDGIYRYSDDRTRGPDNDWVGKYHQRGGEAQGPMVDDAPTWSWARNAAEPFFGQGHAGAAGDVLAAAGMRDAAAAAWLWSLHTEGWNPRIAAAAADMLQALGRVDPAAALRLLRASRFPTVVAAPMAAADAPLAKLPKLQGYLDGLAAAAGTLPEPAAAALRGERGRLLRLAGGVDAEVVRGEPPAVPRALGAFGYVDDSLTDYDEHRVDGLWLPTEAGDLYVGRDRARTATGATDRAADRRPVFVRAAEWQLPGDYVVRLQVNLVTSYVEGAVVLGHWRRDRSVRLSFTAGDRLYASGRNDNEVECDRVHLSLSGLWERDPHMPSSAPQTTVVFDRPKPSFAVELRVRGPTLVVVVEGQEQFRYAAHDGAPIEGYIGFAAGSGAYRVQQPTVQRRGDATAAIGLDLSAAPLPVTGGGEGGDAVGADERADVEPLLGLPVRGLPLDPRGTLVLWLPPVAADDAVDRRLPRSLPVLAKLLGDTVEFPQPWLLAVPAGTAAADIARVQGQLSAHRPQPMAVVQHHGQAALRGRPWVLFVDAAAVLRAGAEVGDPRLFSMVQRWAQHYRPR